MGGSGDCSNYSVPTYKGERVTAEYNPKYRLKTAPTPNKDKYKEKETGSFWSHIKRVLGARKV